ncbi:MAG: ferritin-like domain-containing protein [Actinobacteria bacterium]|nr:ferritin-like domain-containing protein [Actinomycetota bacterium]
MRPRPDRDAEPHLLAEEDFLREVHSFDFWFEAVSGYLEEQPFGHDPDLVETPMDDVARDSLITTLCNYCVGETAALEASSGLVRLAPNHHSRVFLATQVVDEARHLEVFMRRLEDLGVEDPEAEIDRRANQGLEDFRSRLLELVDRGDWDAAVFAQNVLLESMEDTVFRFHEQSADEITRQVLVGVVADERRHLGFGENDLGRRLAHDPSGRRRLAEVRAELDPLVLGSFEGVYRDLGIARQDQPELGRHYLDAVERLGLTA